MSTGCCFLCDRLATGGGLYTSPLLSSDVYLICKRCESYFYHDEDNIIEAIYDQLELDGLIDDLTSVQED